VVAQDGVEAARAGSHGAAGDLHHGQALGIEGDERVEEVEEDGGVGAAHSGFRAL
jgi:hypothetical protein